MKVRVLIVSDNTETRKNKEGVEKSYRTLGVVDQSPEGSTLESMVKVGIPPETNDGNPLSGSVVQLVVRDISSDWRGVFFKSSIASIDGSLRFDPVKPEPSVKKG